MINAICKHLSGCRFRFTNETGLQDGIAELFDRCRIDYLRECSLDKSNRIDFLCPYDDGYGGVKNIGIEVKVDGARFEVVRQLSRYADIQRVDSLILVTSRRRLDCMPAQIGGKEIRVIVTGGGF